MGKHGIENFVFASSSSVYAGSKKTCELLAYTYHHLYKLNVTGLRFFTVYGPRGRPDMAPFTYIDDIVDGVVRCIDRCHKYEIFNLGKGSGTSLKEFIDLVQKHTGKEANIKIMPDQPGDVPYTCADVRKAQKML